MLSALFDKRLKHTSTCYSWLYPVIALPLGNRNQPCALSNACMAGFSSTHIITAFFGGFKYNPIISAAFAENSGSVLMHQLCLRCKCMSCFRKIRHTFWGLTSPKCLLHKTPSHVEKPGGGSSSKAFKMRLSVIESYFFGAPLRGVSCKPFILVSLKRFLHLLTVASLVFSSLAISLFCFPAADNKIIRALSFAEKLLSVFENILFNQLNIKGQLKTGIN